MVCRSRRAAGMLGATSSTGVARDDYRAHFRFAARAVRPAPHPPRRHHRPGPECVDGLPSGGRRSGTDSHRPGGRPPLDASYPPAPPHRRTARPFPARIRYCQGQLPADGFLLSHPPPSARCARCSSTPSSASSMAEANAYYAAFRLPDTLFSLVAGGALSSAMIPVLLTTRQDRGRIGRLATGEPGADRSAGLHGPDHCRRRPLHALLRREIAGPRLRRRDEPP
jgi:hypothetical protein